MMLEEHDVVRCAMLNYGAEWNINRERDVVLICFARIKDSIDVQLADADRRIKDKQVMLVNRILKAIIIHSKPEACPYE